jgi:hypothetical protein
MEESSVKYLQTEFNNTFKRSSIMIKFISFLECKDGSTNAIEHISTMKNKKIT